MGTSNGGPKLSRDANGKLIRGEAEAVKDELIKKFLTETRQHEKEESFHVSKTGRRDVVVHLAVTILPRVDGHTVIGEQEREMGQWCFQLPARSLPMANSNIIKAFSELCHTGKQALLALGLVRP